MGEIAKGSCLCGQYSYEFDRDLVISAHHCHCSHCRKITGSGKATIVLMPAGILKSEGEIKTFTVQGTDGGHVTRGFCPDCGSQIISYLEEAPEVRFVKAGTLEDSSWVKITSSFWEKSAVPWAPVDTDAPAFEGNPVGI